MVCAATPKRRKRQYQWEKEKKGRYEWRSLRRRSQEQSPWGLPSRSDLLNGAYGSWAFSQRPKTMAKNRLLLAFSINYCYWESNYKACCANLQRHCLSLLLLAHLSDLTPPRPWKIVRSVRTSYRCLPKGDAIVSSWFPFFNVKNLHRMRQRANHWVV